MAEIIFQYEGRNIIIQCNKNQKMKDICDNLCNKTNTNLDSLVFLYGGSQLKFDKKYEEITKENKITILVYKIEDENEYCSKCGRILNNKIFDEMLSLNNGLNYILTGLKSQIDNIIIDINSRKDAIYINSQLRNINYIINGINEDIKKINNQLNQIKYNSNNSLNGIEIKKNKINLNNNEIICIYNKQEEEINLLHDYKLDINKWDDIFKKAYLEGKNNINEKNIDIYINDKKIKFNYIYKSEEKGDIKVKFIFKKLLTSTHYMFRGCSSLESIDLSSFNTTNLQNIGNMFSRCSSLKSIDLSSFNTINANDMSFMFRGCSSLKSVDLSSFNTNNVKNMECMFYECSSLKKENVKISKSESKIIKQLNEL